jgi:hypothetical protein
VLIAALAMDPPAIGFVAYVTHNRMYAAYERC